MVLAPQVDWWDEPKLSFLKQHCTRRCSASSGQIVSRKEGEEKKEDSEGVSSHGHHPGSLEEPRVVPGRAALQTTLAGGGGKDNPLVVDSD